MKLYTEFITLTEQGKLKMLTDSSVWLAWRTDEANCYYLYDLDGVYVEVKVSKETSARCYYVFTDIEGLTPYLDGIPITFST